MNLENVPTTKGGIPKIIHQVWINDTHIDPNNKKNLPDDWEISRSEWKRLHPDWQYLLWTDADAVHLLQTLYPSFLKVFYDYPYLIQRADMIRYFILYTFGGIYCDLDLCPIKNIEDFLKYNVDNYFVFSANSNVITNSVMVSTKQNGIMNTIINNLKNDIPWYAVGKHLTVQYSTGPMFLNNILLNVDDPFLILPRNRFNPYSIVEDKLLSENYVFKPLNGSGSWNGIDTHLYNFVSKYSTFFILFGLFSVVLLIMALIYYIFKYRKTQKYCSDVKSYCENTCPTSSSKLTFPV
jgi:mannosyltransferase OCH1-like enzyme